MIPAFLLAALALSIPGAERPRDPFVLRCVLDGRPRMVAIALHEEMWVAYDASDCSLYRVWKGGVSFEGPVYDAVHGPQPTAAGKPYGEPPPARWEVERGGARVPATPRWLGYRLAGEEVTLRYRLEWDGGSCVLEETPEHVSLGAPALRRTFVARAAPWGAEVHRVVDGHGTRVPRDGLIVVDTFDPAAVEGVPANAGKAPRTTADEEREAAARAAVGSVLTVPSLLVAPEIDGAVDEAWDAATAVEVGKLVFGTSDGPADVTGLARLGYDSRHLYALFAVVDDAVVNDSSLTFHDDAVEVYLDGGHERSDFYDENDAQYVFGFGDEDFWVTNQPALHPGVEHASARTPDGYVVEVRLPWANVGVTPAPGLEIGLELHVDDDDDGLEGDAALSWYSSESDSWSDPSRLATVTLGGAEAAAPLLGPREPGLALRVWSLSRGPAELPRLVPGQSPNVNRVVPLVDLREPADFGGLADRFVAEVTGFLTAPEAGKYGFRLTSDDGSRLWIDNWPVIDHDGLHGPTAVEAERELAAGEHVLRIDHFENAGGQQLTLEWRPPGAEEFELVPASALSTRAGEVRVTAPGPKRVLVEGALATPGDRYPLAGVHPSLELATVRPEEFRPKVGGMDLLPDGRLVLCTWDADGAVYVLDGVHADEVDPEAIEVRRIAAGLAEPLGLKVVDGQVFVLQKQELTRLVDLDGDGVTDEYACVSAGWGVTPNFHEFAFGLAFHEGAFWATLATAIEPGGASSPDQHPDRGRAIRIDRGGGYELYASGFRTPNGIGRGVDGELFVTDNQGDWLPASKLVHLVEGAFYGNRSVDPEGTAELAETPPVVWLPQGEIGNSPSQPALLAFGPWAGQMVHGEVTHGGLKRVFVEEVGGAYQGCAFRFTQGLEAGVNRVLAGPDDTLFVGGIGSTGNWGQDGKKRYGLQRLRYTGAPAFEMLAVRALANGLEVELTEPLPAGAGWDPLDYEVRQWRYVPTREYGGPKVDEEELAVSAATVSDDRRRVFLEVDGLRAGRVVYLRLAGPFASEAGRELWSTEAWYTLNRLPERRGETRTPPASAGLAARVPNTLTEEERAQGFELLFDGESLERFRGWRRDDVPPGWRAEAGELRFVPAEAGEMAGGDLTTREQYGSFELRLEWKVSEGGNSGIFFHATEDRPAPWETGPEVQVLDDALHPDGRNPRTSAGANYALHAPRGPGARGAGRWNDVRLVVRGPRVEHWLNGLLVVEYELWSEEWEGLVAASKFASMPDYGRRERGHVVLQDHGDPVAFRNLRIRRLDD